MNNKTTDRLALDGDLLAVEAIIDQRDELLAALRDLLAPHEGECRFDHNGYCQEHFLDHSMDGCRVATARDAIARAEKAK